MMIIVQSGKKIDEKLNFILHLKINETIYE